MKHTPGPWVVSEYPNRHGGCSIRTPSGEGIIPLGIAETYAMAEYMDEETVATARLIAAAPELYTALKAVLDTVHPDVYRMAAAQFGLADTADEAIEQARAALAMVEGNQP